ncbi:hypothetical protein L873DRAFT_1806691 [Choiromyces venosus 120613-1]|uniref:Uncharacterized protein n=1 Tax=Choiromyces venosus 120613-1 TaxID=1336337 RepID=A0A3N4JMM2_9PEZI|nr:hypothetical protein L873DRAFT_1806691 [Choiromyces venosus 120613-1]
MLYYPRLPNLSYPQQMLYFKPLHFQPTLIYPHRINSPPEPSSNHHHRPYHANPFKNSTATTPAHPNTRTYPPPEHHRITGSSIRNTTPSSVSRAMH